MTKLTTKRAPSNLTRMHRLKFIAWLGVLILADTVLADDLPSVDKEFKDSSLVIRGLVISAWDVPEPDDFIRGTFYTVEVHEILKGGQSKTVKIFSENSSGRFPMKVGTPYLIFAYKGTFEGIGTEQFSIGNWGNSATLMESRKALARARELRTKTKQKVLLHQN